MRTVKYSIFRLNHEMSVYRRCIMCQPTGKRSSQTAAIVPTLGKLKSRNNIGMEVAYNFTFRPLFRNDLGST